MRGTGASILEGNTRGGRGPGGAPLIPAPLEPRWEGVVAAAGPGPLSDSREEALERAGTGPREGPSSRSAVRSGRAHSRSRTSSNLVRGPPNFPESRTHRRFSAEVRVMKSPSGGKNAWSWGYTDLRWPNTMKTTSCPSMA